MVPQTENWQKKKNVRIFKFLLTGFKGDTEETSLCPSLRSEKQLKTKYSAQEDANPG